MTDPSCLACFGAGWVCENHPIEFTVTGMRAIIGYGHRFGIDRCQRLEAKGWRVLSVLDP